MRTASLSFAAATGMSHPALGAPQWAASAAWAASLAGLNCPSRHWISLTREQTETAIGRWNLHLGVTTLTPTTSQLASAERSLGCYWAELAANADRHGLPRPTL